MRKLTPKQKKFADHYILTGRARESALHAGYSENSASEIASETLNKPNVTAYIEKQLEELDFDVKVRQKQALDYALRVLHEEETEEHAFVIDETGVQVVRLKPKIKDRTDAAKFITTIVSTVERNKLQNIKLEQEILKLKKELQTENSTEDKLKEYFDKLDGEFNG